MDTQPLTCASVINAYRTRSLEQQLDEIAATQSAQAMRRPSNPIQPPNTMLSRTSFNDLYFDSSALRNMLQQSLAAKFNDKVNALHSMGWD